MADTLPLFTLPGEITVTDLPGQDRWRVDMPGGPMFLGHRMFPTERAARELAAAVLAEGATR